MPAKGFLTQEQLKKLQTALREGENPHLRERILMLLLMNDGKTYREISNFIGCSERTVVHWSRISHKLAVPAIKVATSS